MIRVLTSRVIILSVGRAILPMLFVAGLCAAMTMSAMAQEKAKKEPQKDENANYYVYTMLTRHIIVTLHNANVSGDYSVLRAIVAPSFQAANNPARLAGIFAKLRDSGVNMMPVVLYNPTFTTKPGIDENGMLHLKGHFPTRPHQINFDMLFQNIEEHWKLFSLAVGQTYIVAKAEDKDNGNEKKK